MVLLTAIWSGLYSDSMRWHTDGLEVFDRLKSTVSNLFPKSMLVSRVCVCAVLISEKTHYTDLTKSFDVTVGGTSAGTMGAQADFFDGMPAAAISSNDSAIPPSLYMPYSSGN